MIKTDEDLEAHLRKLDRRFERTPEGTYLVSAGPNQPPIALRLVPPVVLVRVAIGPAPSEDAPMEARVFRQLLELNARDLLHASYGIDDGSIVLSAALENDTIDMNELEAVFADVDLALAEHISSLREMVQTKS